MTTITLPRVVVEQALECLKGVARGKYDGNAAGVCAALEAALAQQAEPVEPVAQQAEPVEPVAWLRVIDEAMVTHHLGVADPGDDYETAKRKMNNLLCMAQDIGTYFAKQAEPVEPAFHGFMSADGTQVDVCFTPSAPRTDGTYATAYYTAPPQRKPLTEEEIDALPWNGSPRQFARAIERLLGGGSQIADRLARHGIPMPEGDPK